MASASATGELHGQFRIDAVTGFFLQSHGGAAWFSAQDEHGLMIDGGASWATATEGPVGREFLGHFFFSISLSQSVRFYFFFIFFIFDLGLLVAAVKGKARHDDDWFENRSAARCAGKHGREDDGVHGF